MILTLFFQTGERFRRFRRSALGYIDERKQQNVNEALKTARSKGLKTIGFTGHEGGLMKSLCDVAIVVPADVTARIQEMHILCAHIICQIIDDMEW